MLLHTVLLYRWKLEATVPWYSSYVSTSPCLCHQRKTQVFTKMSTCSLENGLGVLYDCIEQIEAREIGANWTKGSFTFTFLRNTSFQDTEEEIKSLWGKVHCRPWWPELRQRCGSPSKSVFNFKAWKWKKSRQENIIWKYKTRINIHWVMRTWREWSRCFSYWISYVSVMCFTMSWPRMKENYHHPTSSNNVRTFPTS